MIDVSVRKMLVKYAARYETADFLKGDPSQFMHAVEGEANSEAAAFLASCLSFGSRKQFLPKIQGMIDCAGGDVDGWVRSGRFSRTMPCGCCECFYRFFTKDHMHGFLSEYRRLLDEFGTLGAYVREESDNLPPVRGEWRGGGGAEERAVRLQAGVHVPPLDGAQRIAGGSGIVGGFHRQAHARDAA